MYRIKLPIFQFRSGLFVPQKYYLYRMICHMALQVSFFCETLLIFLRKSGVGQAKPLSYPKHNHHVSVELRQPLNASHSLKLQPISCHSFRQWSFITPGVSFGCHLRQGRGMVSFPARGDMFNRIWVLLR